MYTKQRAAIYARYSTDSQSATSIEDQVRRCKKVAEEFGYTVEDENIYSDAAVSGKNTALHQREGFIRLLKAIEQKQFSAVVIDELSRAGRGMKILSNFADLLSRRGVRLISADRLLDSNSPTFQVFLGFFSGMSGHELAQTKERTARGMEGVLKRGGMVGYPPFGYILNPRPEGSSGHGATWSIHEENSKHIRFMFESRSLGKSYQWIATYLQNAGVPCPRKSRTKGGGFWRANTVKQLLGRTIFRGVFIWNGSDYTKYKSKKENRVAEQVEYARPQLRIVSDELWYSVQGERGANNRKGLKHQLTHRINCGVCGNTCTLRHTSHIMKMLYCASCQMRRLAGLPGNQFLEISAQAALTVVRAALLEVVKKEVKDAYRAILVEVASRSENELYDATRRAADKLSKQITGLAKVLALGLGDVDEIANQIQKLQSDLRRAQTTLSEMEQFRCEVTPAEIDAHVQSLDNDFFITALFGPGTSADNGNEILKRIFPRITFTKHSRAESLWTLEVNLHELAHHGDSRRLFQRGGRILLTYSVTLFRARSGSVYTATLVDKRLLKPEEYVQSIECDNLEAEIQGMYT